MDENRVIKAFWNCGDSQIVSFAIVRARLNRHEKEAVRLLLDECQTQEQAAESLDISVRELQSRWNSAKRKLLSIPWVFAYGKELLNG